MTRQETSGGSRGIRFLRTEGPRSVLARTLDHLADRRREGSFRRLGAAPPGWSMEPPPVLNLLGFPPRRSRGGVALQLLDRLEVEANYRTTALLFPLDGRARLEVRTEHGGWTVDCGPAWPGEGPDSGSVLSAALAQALRITSAAALHVESVVGLPLPALLEMADRLPVMLSAHDFGLFCERPHLIETGTRRFCEYSRDFARCRHCLASGQSSAGDPETRRRLAGELLGKAAAAIFASSFIARAHQELFPEVTLRPILLAPAIRLQRPILPTAARSGPIVHVAYAGALNDPKGAAVLDRLLEQRQEIPEVRRWSVYGGGDPEWRRRLARHSGVRFQGWHRARTLPGLLVRDKVDLLLLPSLSPEAHCLVLDEGWTAGVPALASRRGALGERVSEVGGGWIADPSDFSSALAQRVRGPFEAIAEVREHIARWRPWTPEDAAGGILTLYRTCAGDARLSHRIR